MPSQVTNYKCPACGAPLHFSEITGKVECDYCGSSYDAEEIEAKYKEKNAEAEKAAQEDIKKEYNTNDTDDSWGEEGKNMKMYDCPSCGAQIFCDDTTAATSCPYCGNPSIISGQFSGIQKPDYVLPFKFEKKQAVEALKKHYKSKLLLPNAFTINNHIEEIKGIYIPFWLFDIDVDGDMSYHATRTTVTRQGDYKVSHTMHYDVYRSAKINFEKIPVDGSAKMPDDYMDSIEPFDYKELKKFAGAYLTGFFADKYDVDKNEAAKRADERCRETSLRSIKNTVNGYDTINEISRHININSKDVKYALMPVWLLTTKWNNKNYLFAMNGQTGKFVGDLPVDKRKLNFWFWSVAIGASAIFSFLFSGTLGNFITGLFS